MAKTFQRKAKKKPIKSGLQSSNAMAHKPVGDLAEIAAAINKTMGEGTIILGNTNIVKVEAIPTGIASLDAVIGIGGIPRGRIVELYGAESSGKTTTTLQIIANCQKTYFDKYKRNGVCAFIDAEHALDPIWAEQIGVDMDNLFFNQPDTGEQAFDVLEKLADTGRVDLIVVDSLASLVPKEEIDGELQDKQVGAQARMVSKAMRRIKGKINKGNCAVVFVNQVRNKIGVMFGSPEDSPGGRALKFYAAVRIDLRRGEAIHADSKQGNKDDQKSKTDSIGQYTKIKIVKNKTARPFRTCQYGIYFGASPGGDAEPIFGIDVIGSLFDAAAEHKLIKLSGSSYYFDGQIIGSGRLKAMATVRGNEAMQNKVKLALFEHYVPNAQDVRDMDVEDLANHLSDGDEMGKADEIEGNEIGDEDIQEMVEDETGPA